MKTGLFSNRCATPAPVERALWLAATVLMALSVLLAACVPATAAPPVSPTAEAFHAPLVASALPAQPRISPTSGARAAGIPDPTSEQPLVPVSEAAVETPLPTSAASPTSEPGVRFAVIGDFGLAGEPLAQVAALVDSWAPDLIISTGDNNYPDGAAATIDENIGQYFHNYIAPYQGAYGPGAEQNRFFPTLGNHDWTAHSAQPYLDYFTLPGNERYYDFVWGPVHFFALDADSREPDGVSYLSPQAEWLQAGLTASTTPWQVVYMHQPPYSSGTHGSVEWMRWPFAEWGADVVLGGHDHTYERLEIDGLPYIVNGVGGGPIYYFNDPLPGSLVRYADDYGAMLVEATSHSMRFQFITRQGQVIDDFNLQAPP